MIGLIVAAALLGQEQPHIRRNEPGMYAVIPNVWMDGEDSMRFALVHERGGDGCALFLFCRTKSRRFTGVEKVTLVVDSKTEDYEVQYHPKDDGESLMMTMTPAQVQAMCRAKLVKIRVGDERVALRPKGMEVLREFAAELPDHIGRAISMSPTPPARDIAVDACGAETLDGTPCRRRVAGGGPCYQHR